MLTVEFMQGRITIKQNGAPRKLARASGSETAARSKAVASAPIMTATITYEAAILLVAMSASLPCGLRRVSMWGCSHADLCSA
jgi:hypothetical protein